MSSSMCTAAILRRALPLRRPGVCRARRAIARALSTDSFFISRNSKSQPVQVSRSFISQSRERVLSGIQPTGVPHIGAHPSAPRLPMHKPPCASCSPELYTFALFRPVFALDIFLFCRQLLWRPEAMGLPPMRRAGLQVHRCCALQLTSGSLYRTRTFCLVYTALLTFMP